MTERILVVDDDANLLKSIAKILKLENYSVDTLINGLETEKYITEHNYHCLLLDVKMPVISGMEVLKMVNRKYPAIPVIMISGQSDIETAVGSVKEGAYDFIEKPINPERLIVAVKNALQRFQLQEINESIFMELQQKFRLIGKSPALKQIVQQISDIADTPAKVLITGESGTGKELVAWAIHHNSQRRGKPYLKLNCAAIPVELLESELFGHRKGSFTGAYSDHKGKFAEAQGGTLFLDEIGDMSFQLQAKLLRVLDENEIEVIGENVPRKVDVRIIAATNKDLEKLVTDGKFREDLYYRLNVVKIHIPPLKERPEDILPLGYHFLKEFSNSYNKQVISFTSHAENLLIHYQWPGNVRQLRNVLEKMVLFGQKNEIGYEDALRALELVQSSEYSDRAGDGNGEQTLKTAVADYEKKYILMVLQNQNWKISRTAQMLGIDRSNLFKKMRKYGIKN
jgi:two-component system nitrogen regulation response regulator NtrX